jgi:hypothetical protein
VLIAIGVGMVIFVLAGDFVIGVGVGTAVFAIARRAITTRGRKQTSRAGAAEEPDREHATR